MKKIRAMHSWVLLCPEQRVNSTSSLIIASELNADKTGHAVALVVDIPSDEEGVCLWHKSIDSSVPCRDPGFKLGDRVMYRDYLKDINEVTLNGVKHCLVHWEDLLAVVPPDVEVTNV